MKSSVQMPWARFSSLWQRCLTPGVIDDGRETYERLCGLYSSPGRSYHTPDHIGHCLARFDQCSHLMDRPDAVEMALWFHDAIYDPRASDNEERSARLFAQLAGGRCEHEFIDLVCRLILITVHREQPCTTDERFTVDIDLSGFGLPWAEFSRDSELVRAEYLHLSDEAFYEGQTQFLRALVARERFYRTDYFHERYEETARANVARTLAELDAAGHPSGKL